MGEGQARRAGLPRLLLGSKMEGKGTGPAPSAPLGAWSPSSSCQGGTGCPLLAGWGFSSLSAMKTQLKLTIINLSALEINLPPIGCW